MSDARSRSIFAALAIALILVAAVAVVAATFPSGVDWHGVYRPAARAVLEGRSPYTVVGFYNPPWTLIPLLPVVLLPEPVDKAVMTVAGFVAFAFVAHRLGARPLGMMFFLLSPSVHHCLLNGNIEWLALLGLVMPPRWGLFFVLFKPQVAGLVAVYWVYSAWREGGVANVVALIAPVALVAVASLLVFGLWPLLWDQVTDQWWSASLWPMSLPIGLVLFVASLRRREPKLAVIASPFLSPHVLLHSWAGAVVSLVQSELEIGAVVLGQWILLIMVAINLA